MIIKSKQIKGMGRGHKIGFPTINLATDFPEIVSLEEGVYATWVDINGKTYRGAMHYGSIPTFDQTQKTLEVHLIDVTDEDAPDTNDITIELDIVDHLRDIEKFSNIEDLAYAINQDVKRVREILK